MVTFDLAFSPPEAYSPEIHKPIKDGFRVMFLVALLVMTKI